MQPIEAITVSVQQLKACGASQQNAEVYAPLLNAKFGSYQINNRLRLVHLLAQILHETGNLGKVSENLNYSQERLLAVWPKRFKSPDSAQPFAVAKKYAHDPKKLGNLVYGGRLGNKHPDDGYLFRGRGGIDTTGRANYEALQKGLRKMCLQHNTQSACFVRYDYVEHPEHLERPEDVLISALWYWQMHGLNALADQDNLNSISVVINGGKIGLTERKNALIKCKKVFGLIPTIPTPKHSKRSRSHKQQPPHNH